MQKKMVIHPTRRATTHQMSTLLTLPNVDNRALDAVTPQWMYWKYVFTPHTGLQRYLLSVPRVDNP